MSKVTDKAPKIFDDLASKEKAIELAKKKWSWSYQDFLVILKAVGKAEKDATKIPDELIVPLKEAILEECINIVQRMEEKASNGEPF